MISVAGPSRIPWEHGGVDWTVTVLWSVQEGSLRCVGLELTNSSGAEVTASVTRALRVAEVVRRARRQRFLELGGDFVEYMDDADPQDPQDARLLEEFSPQLVESVRAETNVAKERRRGRPVEHDDDHYRRVSNLYRDAMRGGMRPRQFIADAMHAAKPSVSRWIAEARARGHLEPAQRRARSSRHNDQPVGGDAE